MYYETKIAVRKAFALGRMLFGLGSERYEKLFAVIATVRPPTQDELQPYIERGYSLEDAMIAELQDRYKRAAVLAGFAEKYGLAMLEYAAMEQELKS
jgi:hypothetical protein